MKTNRHPQDYEHNDAIIPALEAICPQCGGYYSASRGMCLHCGCGASVMVWEYNAADIRALIAECNEAAALDQIADARRENRFGVGL